MAIENGRDSRADPRRYSRAALLAVIAAREAWNDAGLRADEPGAGVIIGSGGGGIDVGEAQYRDFFTTGGRHVTPYAIAVGIVGMMSSEVSISLGLRGISHVLSTGCTSSTDALGYAARDDSIGRSRRAAVGRRRRVRHAGHDLRVLAHARRVDAVQRPAGGGQRPSIAGATASCWAKARGCTSSRRRSARGRAARRSTRRSRAITRRATPTTACRWIRTAGEIVAAMRGAVERSDRALEEIGYINYHGTSTQLNDADRVAMHPSGVRRAGRARARVVDQVDDRPSAGCQRRRRHRHHRAGAVARLPAADGQPAGCRPGVRHGLPVARGRAARPAAALCNCLGFGSKNSAIVFGSHLPSAERAARGLVPGRRVTRADALHRRRLHGPKASG